MIRVSTLVCIVAVIAPASILAQPGPVVDMDGVTIEKIADIPNGGAFTNRHPVRIARNPADGALYVLATSQADGKGPGSTSIIYRLEQAGDGSFDMTTVLTGDEHGTPRPVGMAFGPDGSMYLVGNDDVGDTRTQIVVRRGTPSGNGWDWTTVATSEPYLFSNTNFDHRANAIIVSLDGSTLIINSGARTDHGEMYGGVREEGLTAVLLKVPADGTDIVLPNDRDSLRADGYVFAEGNRNMADLAFAPNGDLFGSDNAGDRDDPDELNWLREGEHYGFPWRIGGNATPMQFPGYDPNSDPLVPSPCNSNNADTGCYFGNDPNYPAPPEGVTFVEPIPNAGPFADKFRDPETGDVRDASEEGISISTFSGGRVPMGLVFDSDSLLAEPVKGGAFVLSFGGNRGGFPADGQDLVFLDLDKSEEGYTASTERVAYGFTRPVDAVMVDNVIYLIEFGDWFSAGGSRGVWAVTFPRATNTASEFVPELPNVHLAAFPNPATDAITLTYGLPTPTVVRVELIDLLGRVVQTTEQAAGTDRLVFSTSGLQSGVYLVRLTAGSIHETRTVTVVR